MKIFGKLLAISLFLYLSACGAIKRSESAQEPVKLEEPVKAEAPIEPIANYTEPLKPVKPAEVPYKPAVRRPVVTKIIYLFNELSVVLKDTHSFIKFKEKYNENKLMDEYEKGMNKRTEEINKYLGQYATRDKVFLSYIDHLFSANFLEKINYFSDRSFEEQDEYIKTKPKLDFKTKEKVGKNIKVLEAIRQKIEAFSEKSEQLRPEDHYFYIREINVVEHCERMFRELLAAASS